MLSKSYICEIIRRRILDEWNSRVSILFVEEVYFEVTDCLSFLCIFFKVTKELSEYLNILIFGDIINEKSRFEESSSWPIHSFYFFDAFGYQDSYLRAQCLRDLTSLAPKYLCW